ncbi:type II toxin-antitoxin system HicA family toxin [Mycolicibacterium sp. XJ2546]
MIAKPEKTTDIVKRLRAAGFASADAKGSHTKWSHPSGVHVVVPTGHKSILTGVVRKVDKAIEQSKGK